MFISDFHSITIMLLVLIISSVFLFLALKLYKVSAYNIFYAGFIIFFVVGYLLAHIMNGDSSVLNGDTTILKGILDDILLFWVVSSIGLFLQRKRIPVSEEFEINDRFKRKAERTGKVVSYLTFVFVFYVVIAIDLSTAPLLNIGKYSFQDMAYARSVLYQGEMVQRTYILQYVISYLAIPALFLMRGIGLKINPLILFFFLFFSLLTLSKTLFVFIVVFYFFGKFMATNEKRNLIKLTIGLVGGFYLIVYATYYVDVQRGFSDVMSVLLLRMIVAPVTLSALYADIFTFGTGLRSSVYYTYIFGGDPAPLSKIAMQSMVSFSDGNSPAGIIGAAFPNIPVPAHVLYYSVFIGFMLIGSNFASGILNLHVRFALSGVFGITSWFFFLTDPLSALNSYGLIYIFTFILLYRFFKRKKRLKRSQLISIP